MRGSRRMDLCSYCISLRGTAFSEAAEKTAYNMTRYPHQPSCGCPLCQLILNSLSRQCRESGLVDDDNTPIYPEGEISIGGVVGSSGERWIWVGHLLRASDPWGDSTADVHDASVAMLKEWPRMCHRNHPGCPRADETFLPTRLVEVGSEGDENVRLVTTSELNLSDRRYIALSHCWGLNMPPCAQTFKETLRDHKEEINLIELTKTFVDAIIMVRKLQVPFMADVYSNAYGCCIHDDGQESIWPYIDIPIIGNREEKGYQSDLSPRIAHFFKDTVIWECRTLRASLSYPWKDSFGISGHRRVFDTDSYGRKFPDASQHNTNLTEEQRLLVVADWVRLQTDVLPAISGIARIFARFGPGAYGAGCFESHGIISFLWVVDTPHTDKEIESLVTIKTISMTLSGNDKFGQLRKLHPAGLALFGSVNGNEVCESVYCLACAKNRSSQLIYKRVGRIRAMEKSWSDEPSTEIIVI
ncbi:HET-domain-containing protein [Annulohypoxylon stygium]|nr:HET-domain-containing protein [Annulohypoxylon stygium]